MQDLRCNKRSGFGRACLLIILGAAVLLAATYEGYRLWASGRLRAELEAIRRAGYPATCAELNEWYKTPPAGENAAEVYEEAFRRMVDPHEEKAELLPVIGLAELPPPGEPLPPEMKNVAAEHLCRNEDALNLLEKAAALEQCRYRVDLSRGLATFIPHLPDVQEAAVLLQLASIVYADDGNSTGAVRCLRSLLGLAQSLRNEPTIISQLIRIVCKRMSIDALKRVLLAAELTDVQLAALARGYAEAEDPRSMTRGLVGERCMFVDVANMRQKDVAAFMAGYMSGEDSHSLALVCFIWKAAGLRDLDAAKGLDLLGEAVAASQEPLPARIKAAQAVEYRVAALLEHKWLHPVSRTLMPAVGRAMEADARTIAKLRAARTALAVERYRIAKGILPDELAELVPSYLESTPEDPFDGNPIRYKKLPRGYVVYSIGTDGKDDGGVEDGDDGEPDTTFKLERDRR